MKRIALILLLCGFSVSSTSAQETIDTLLPPPSWFRRHAEQLNVDTDTRDRIERVYKEKEPTYHQLKYKVERLAGELYPSLVADELDEELIAKRMKALLEAENALKLYQVHVRISVLSLVTAEQREAARELAKKSPPPANWRGGVAAKVERVRELSKKRVEKGESVKSIEQRMKQIDKAIADGEVSAGLDKLEELIRDLEQ